MNQPKRYTVTAALPYANGPIHIGHVAGCYLPSDIYVRYLRLKNRDVKFICGSDEHGVAITIKAKKEGKTPQQVVDHYHQMMGDALKGLGISFDHYSRTSSEIHRETASEFFKTLYDKGVFEEKRTAQYFDEEAQQFLADRYIIGECPNCHHDSAYGDQCEKCGTSLSPTDLINPKSTLSGSKPVLKETVNWFLPLDKLSPKIREYVESHKEDWKPNVYGQCKSWLDAGDGLQPRSMTRDLDWGVPVPVEGAEGKVLYVWFDAPIGYISATKEHLPNDWETYWKDKETKLVHFIGKDNIVFHSIIFPAILMEHGDYILPDQVPANEFLNLEGDKISTSRNWAVWLHEYLEEFPGKEDALRYTLCATAPETKDNDFTWKDFQTRNNSELVAILGNFFNRVMVLNQKYYDGNCPRAISLTAEDEAVLNSLSGFADRIGAQIENYKFRDALFEFMNLARTGNKYLADAEPWKVVKEDAERAEGILFVSTQIAATLAKLVDPFMPFTAAKMRKALSLDAGWAIPEDGVLITDAKFEKPELLFSKIEEEAIQQQLDKLEAAKVNNQEAAPQKEETTFEDFQKMDIRTATILEASEVKKADKLLEIKVDTGIDVRTVVSGIAKHYKPEEIIGKKVLVLANLAPRKMRGIVSQGMILMAEDKDGKLVFASPESDVSNGSIVA